MHSRRNRRIRRQFLLIFLAFPIIFLSVTLSWRSLQQFRAQEIQSNETRSFLYPWTNLALDIRRAESSQRGYLLTGRREYLRPYELIEPRVDRELDEIDRLSADDPNLRETLREVRQLSKNKMGELRKTIVLFEGGHRQQALDEINSDRGDEYMSRIAALMSKVREYERARLDTNARSSGTQARNTFLVSTAGDLVLLLFLAIAGFVIDREDQTRALNEESIRTLNERLSVELKNRTDILQSIQDGFCAFNSEQVATYVNPAVEKILGIPAERLLGKTCGEILDEQGSTGIREEIRRAVQQRLPVRSERFIAKYGRWLLLRYNPSPDGGFTLYFSDITEDKQADEERGRLQAEVEQARTLLDTFFENAPVGMGVWDRVGRFLRVNRALAKMNGMPAESHIGKSIPEVLPEVAPVVAELFDRVLKGGESILGFEVSGTIPGFPVKTQTWTASYYPIRFSGEIFGLGAVIEDITERKAMEENLRQSAKLESLGVLAGGIAHDFNNLLTGILGNASLAMDSLSANNPARVVLADVVSASERAAHLTRQMLAYAGKGRFVLQAVDVSELVREIASLVRMSMRRNVQMRFHLQDRLPCVMADIGQLQQLIMNLVINGAEAIPDERQGVVMITTGLHDVDENYINQTFSPGEITPGRYVYLEVHDDGVGMDSATIARIFDPFFTTKFTGRGLGLAAVLGIVRGHKGALKVYSTPGKGTAFKVLLPATEDTAPKPESARTTRDLRGSATVMVIDDEEIVRRTTKVTLERYGYTVVVADNGQEGVELLRVLADKVSLVLLDLTMPVMSGEDALREIRNIRSDIRVILSSGYNEVEAVRRFTGKGLAGFLQKPYTAQKLAEVVRTALENPEEIPGGEA